MNEEEFEITVNDSLWIAHTLFNRNKVTGSTANLSFRAGNYIYVSGTGTCFGRLKKEEFAKMDLDGNHLGGVKPSKEYPLHLLFYQKNKDAGAVLHTHSFYSTLWSCYCEEKEGSAIPKYTPYLEMKLGSIGLIPYAPPGSKQLFDAFAKNLDARRGYLLRNHGPVVGDKNLLSAFYALEELEESARIAWMIRNERIEGTVGALPKACVD